MKEHLPTLKEAFEEFINDRLDLRKGTRTAYENAFKRVDPDIAAKRIDDIKFSDLRRMYMKMRYEDEYKPSSIILVNNVLNPVFETYVLDGKLERNPNHGALKSISKGDGWKCSHRKAVSHEDQTEFLKYIHETKRFQRWENLFVFLFGTGCRVSEVIGLRWNNIDLEKDLLTIDHAVTYYKSNFVEGPTKSSSGIRTIPILPQVKQALVNQQKMTGNTEYVFYNARGKMLHPQSINQIIISIIQAHNAEYPEKKISDFTSVHQTRHSFATMLCERDINLKVIQSVMGHSDIGVTMNIYAEVSETKKQQEFAALGSETLTREQ